MFEIAGLFLDDKSDAHLESVNSLSNFMQGLLGDMPSVETVFSMQSQVYQIHEIGSQSLEKAVMVDRSFDCKGGCDSCCHATDVGVTPSELFYLANFIATREHNPNNKHSFIPPRKQERDPCPLLQDGWCSVYEARPLSCRYIMSTDVNSCLKRKMSLMGGAKLPPPFSHFRSSIAAAQFILFRKLGLDARWLVMDYSLQKILENEITVSQWIAGEQFADADHKLEEPQGKFRDLIEAAEQAA